MNRHLHNTLSALVASASMLVVGLIAAAPLMPQDASLAPSTVLNSVQADQQVTTPATAAVGTPAPVQLLADALDQAASHTIDTSTQTRSTWSSQRERRQTLVMPYLSFVPRG